MEASDAEPVQKDKNEIEHTEAKPIKPVYTYEMKTMEVSMHSTSGVETVPLQAGPMNFLVAKFSTHILQSEFCNLMLSAPIPKPVKKKPAAAAAAAAAEDAHVAAEPVPAAAPVKKRPAAARRALQKKKRPAEDAVVAAGPVPAAAEAAAAAAEDDPVAAEPIPAAAPAMKRPAAARVKKRPAAAPAAAPAVAPAVAPVPAPVAAAAAAAAAADDRNDYGIMLYKNNSIGIRAKFGEHNQVLSFGGLYCGKSSQRLRAIGAEIVRDLQLGHSIPVCKAKGNLLAFA